jgi:hypothetical protein
MRELPHGFFGEVFSKNGSPLVPFFGFMANVCPSTAFDLAAPDRILYL